jgi:hypothetical protein
MDLSRYERNHCLTINAWIAVLRVLEKDIKLKEWITSELLTGLRDWAGYNGRGFKYIVGGERC